MGGRDLCAGHADNLQNAHATHHFPQIFFRKAGPLWRVGGRRDQGADFLKHRFTAGRIHQRAQGIADAEPPRGIVQNERFAGFFIEPVPGHDAVRGQIVFRAGFVYAEERHFVPRTVRDGDQLVFAALQRHISENAHMIHGLQGGERRAIEPKRHAGAIAVDFHIPLAGRALGKPATAQAHHRVLRPVGLVDKEGVLASFAVVSDEPLVVPPAAAALIPGVGGEIEHIPFIGRPQPRTAGKGLEHALVV